jgi:hypothetical protein
MHDDPVELDKHRGMAAQRETELRRQLQEVAADQAALERRQAEIEAVMNAAPSTTWTEAAVRASYLLHLFAGTLEGREPRRAALIDSVIEDLSRLAK